jgi:hypothetical protein
LFSSITSSNPILSGFWNLKCFNFFWSYFFCSTER